MKKLLILTALLCALLSMSAYAEEMPEYGVITAIENEAQMDLDGDGTPESIKYEVEIGDDGYDTGYTLKINDAEVTAYGCDMNRQLYVLCLDDYNRSLLLMVSDYGPSDDHETTFYYWKNGEILPAGKIYAMPENMKVSGNGIITASIRGQVLHTWFHEDDFAMGTGYDEEWNESYYMYRIPRFVYPMGHIVTLKVDLPLIAGMTSSKVSATLAAGTQAVLCATDDVEWVYIQAVGSSESGWMRIGEEYSYECVVGDKTMYSYEVFDGLLFAD